MIFKFQANIFTFKTKREKQFFLIGLLIIINLIAYGKILDAFFVATDGLWLEKSNNFKYLFFHIEGYFRPFTKFVFLIMFNLFGLNPLFFKLLSLGLHILNTILVYFVVKKFLNKNAALPVIEVSFFAALFFSITFAHFQSIVFTANLNDLIGTMCFLLTTYFTIKFFNENKFLYLVLAIICFILGVLSREMVLMFLFFLPVIYFYFKNESQVKFKKFFIILIIFLVLSLFYVSLYLFFAPLSINPHKNEYKIGIHFIKNFLIGFYELMLSVIGKNSLLDFPFENYLNKLFKLEGIKYIVREINLISAIILFFFALNRQFFKENRKLMILSFLLFVFTFLPFSFFIYFEDVAGALYARYRYLYLPSIGFSILGAIFLVAGYECLKKINLNLAKITATFFLLSYLGSNIFSIWYMEYIFEGSGKNVKALLSSVNHLTKNKDNLNIYFLDFPQNVVEAQKFHFSSFVKIFLNKSYQIKWDNSANIFLNCKQYKAKNIYFLKLTKGEIMNVSDYYNNKLKQICN